MATYYVRSSGGDDANAGTTFATGWATIAHAITTATSNGDIVLICADGTHTPSAGLSFGTASGSNANPIIYRGASSTGADDGTVATISGSSLPASTALITTSTDDLYIKFHHLRLTAATSYGFYLSDVGSIGLEDVRVDNCTSHGIFDYESNSLASKDFVNCEIDNNGGDGIHPGGTGHGGHKVINCLIHDNTGDGAKAVGQYSSCYYDGCLFYNNGGDGLNNSATTRSLTVNHCTFFNNTSDGISTVTTSGYTRVINSIFRSNGGYAINTNTGDLNQFSYVDYNCYSSNTSGNIDINSGTPPGSNNVTSDPLFTSETAGSEDFTLQSGSPCIDKGQGYNR